VDDENPSVRASTGFPLCVPRNASDAGCPLANRPIDANGNYVTIFTFPSPADVVAGGPDPRLMAPLVVGDYVTYSGIKAADGTLEVYSLQANLGFYTAPGTQPAYITVEAAQYGVNDADPTVEVAESRATAVATDINTSIQWFAIDVDPCTGAQSERNLLLAEPEGAAPAGLTTYRLGKVVAAPVTAAVGFRYTNGVTAGPRGIIAGQFIQPIMTFIFPELITYGGQNLPNQFDQIPFLYAGSGPLAYGNYLTPPLATPPIVGQLHPWPGATPPATTVCPPPSSTTTSAPGSTPSGGPPDFITILSATTRNQKGSTTTVVTAESSSLLSQLFLTIIGADNVGPQAMDKLGNGQFTLTISTKGKPDFVEVTSSLNGNPITEAV